MRDQVNDALKAAIKAQDKRRVSTLRLMNAAIKDRDIAARGAGRESVSEAELLELFAKMIKQREESADIYAGADRPELAQGEREEIAIIREFLPRQLSGEETRAACEQVMTEIGATGIKDMGRTMATLKERYAGQIDFGEAGKVIKDRLK
jgi:uncharacterized protein YqeY